MNANEIITCAECGAIIEGEVRYGSADQPLCPDCIERLGLVKCDHCDRYVDPDCTIEYEGITICEDCRDNAGLVQCSECGGWHDPCDITHVYAGWRYTDLDLCESCLDDMIEQDRVFYCEDCEDYYLSRAFDSYETAYGTTICEGCRSDHYYYCEDCGRLFTEDDIVWNEDEEEYYCEHCAENHHARIHDYGFRPHPVFHGVNHTPRFGDPITIGFELEVDDGDDEHSCAEDIMSAFDEDTLYLKHDSSVTFEIVTHPHTLDSYLNEFDLDKLCEIPGRYGFSSHNCGTCGLHMHVGRAQLGDCADSQFVTISKIALLMYRHWDSLVKFSRRRQEQLDHWAHAPAFKFNKYTTYTDDKLVSLVQSTYSCLGRYQALNLENRGTIEFRLWRGTLVADTIRATLQLTHNIVRYCMEHTFEDVANCSWPDVTGFETYEALDKYLAARGLVYGEEPKEIPYNNQPVRADDDTTFGWRIGDRVRIVRGDDLVNAGMVGATGTVVTREHTLYGDNKYLLRIDLDSCPRARNLAHYANGRMPDHDGYWVYETSAELIDESAAARDGFRVGDRVCMVDTSQNPYGHVGTIVMYNGEHDIAVRFDDFERGHDLGEDDGTSNGWWCCAEQLTHAA